MMKLFKHTSAKLQAGITSITWKLFFVTAVMFIVFISLELVFQFSFIEKFYYAAKEDRSIKALDEFCRDYAQNTWDRSMLDSKSAYMSDTYDMQLAILNYYGNNKYGGIEMTVRSTNGKEVCIDLHDVSFIDYLKTSGMEVGKKVSIKGLFSDDGLKLRPFEINIGDTKWRRSGSNENGNPSGTIDWNYMVQVDGKIEYLRLMNEDEYENIGSPFVVLKAALKQWQEENIHIPDKRCLQEYKDNSTGNKYKMFVFPFVLKNGSKEAVFAIVPLQPVDEAIEVIKDYLVYIFLAAFIFVLLLSFIYSRMVTQPLIKINMAAVRISHMDFSAKCDIHSRDELGSLSESLNVMSCKLDSTITELKEFVSNASHELKTPISAMGVYLEALRDDIRKDKRERYLERLQYEVDKMNSLVRAMLELSRMEADTHVLNKEQFDLQSLLNEVLNEFKELIQEKNLRISIKTGQEPPLVFADRIKLSQVIRNFITNAHRHTACGGEIWIEILKEETEVTFSIENQGNHIPEEKIDRIWERFYRIESSRARNEGGTGLGLAISSKILQLHNAQFGVRNTERGVLFYFIM